MVSKMIACLLLGMGVVSFGFVAQAGQAAAENPCCSVVDDAYTAAQAIRPGTKRPLIPTTFERDGGLSFRDETVYVFSRCKMIKIKIYFNIPPNSPYSERDQDTVKSVSAPYLQLPFKD